MKKEEIDKYLKDPYQCPVCGSLGIETNRLPETEGTTCTQEIKCTDCESAWIDIYTLTDFKIIHNGNRLGKV